jgi:outer membrane protein OmpA-like peptidoglycan-associated protein
MTKVAIALFTACGVLSAQPPATPLYRVTVTSRTAKAISYQHRSGATKIDFAGTALVPKARGTASVEGKKGYIGIAVEFRDLPEATQFGTEYLTYVLWAITPDGRTSNLGEILRSGTSGKLDVTTELQTFGLVVTAEPYFAVSRPSDVVVMENVVRADTIGNVEPIDAKYELLQRGQYEHLANVLDLQINRRLPLELYEARNALQIARTSGADKYATDIFQKAEADLKQAEEEQTRNAGSKAITMTARNAVQTAEDARAIAVKRQDDDIVAADRKAAEERELVAVKGRATAQADADRVTREAADARSKAEAEAVRLKQSNDAQALAAQAEADRLKRSNEAQTLAAQTEADRVKRDNDSKMLLARNEADRLKSDNDAQKAAAQAELDRIGNEKSRLEKEKIDLRSQLLLQFNTILQTRDTARGLIVNMSDVLFDSGKFTLRPEAQVKLARVAGIVEGHPGLRLAVEGHTDSVGSDDYNQQLSERRGASVRADLIEQGMPAASVTSNGFGKTQPVVSNDTAAGRQQNRRVELIISGDIIGTAIGVPPIAN